MPSQRGRGARGAERDAEGDVLAINERLRRALADVSEAEESVRGQAERLARVNEFARTIGRTLDVQSVYALTANQIPVLMPCVRCVLGKHEGDGDAFRLVAAWTDGSLSDMAQGATIRRAEYAPAAALERGAPVVWNDLSGERHPYLRKLYTEGVRSFCAVPVLAGSSPWGTLNVGFVEAEEATEERVRLLESLAAHVGGAIRNAVLYGRLQLAHEELAQTQEQVVQQERLRALGEMASGIAHDFNNALAPVLGFSELLAQPGVLQDPTRAAHFLELIRTAAGDAAGIVARLREFYRDRDTGEAHQPLDLPALVEQAIALAQPRWKDQAQAEGRTIHVRQQVEPVPAVVGDARELREALMNLIFNAVDAMPRGGTITVRVKANGGLHPADDQMPANGRAAPNGRTPNGRAMSGRAANGTGEAVAVEVRDTGQGMTEDVRRRCMEPFFTTKGERGTGLGLSMVYGIVQRHGGALEIDSAPGSGTTVRLVFPVAAPAHGRAPGRAAGGGVSDASAAAGAASGGGTGKANGNGRRTLHVLLVDDEPALRTLLAALLTVEGHTADMAADGLEGWDRFSAGAYDLVLTDRAMPRMNGDQLAAAIKQKAPETAVIMLTGYGALMGPGDVPPGVDAVLSKPVTREALRRAIAEAVGEEGVEQPKGSRDSRGSRGSRGSRASDAA